MRTSAFLPLALVAFCPKVPPAQARPHPAALRRERLNRQLAHTRGRKGHR